MSYPSGPPDASPYPAPPYGPGTAGPAAPSPGAWPPPDALHLPLPGASFPEAVVRYVRKFGEFQGRASRSEFWWVEFLHLLVTLVLMIPVVAGTSTATVDATGRSHPGGVLWFGVALMVVYGVANIVPMLALIWRRLHDANLPGPFYFFACIPYAGSLVLLIFTLLGSNPQGARFDRVAGSVAGR